MKECFHGLTDEVMAPETDVCCSFFGFGSSKKTPTKAPSGASTSSSKKTLYPCSKCRKQTVRRYFCESCVREHEERSGKPFNKLCNFCVSCSTPTLNDKYCDSCHEIVKKDGKPKGNSTCNLFRFSHAG